MALQHLVQLGQEGRRDPLAADLQQGFQIMGMAAEEAGLGRGQGNRHSGTSGYLGRSGYHDHPFRPYYQWYRAARAVNAG